MAKKLALSNYAGAKHFQLNKLFKIFQVVKPLTSKFGDVFCGMGSVSINSNYANQDIIVNDKNYALYLIWKHFNHKVLFEQLKKEILNIDYGELPFNTAKSIYDDDTNWKNVDETKLAVSAIVVHRMSRSGQGTVFSWSDRLRGGRPEKINSWENYKLTLDELHCRIKNFTILNKDFRDVLNDYNLENYLLYCDSPYLHSTRRSKKLYKHEMSIDDHAEMLDLCLASKAKIVISGRPSELYDFRLKGWQTDTTFLTNHMGQTKKKTKSAERVWFNF